MFDVVGDKSLWNKRWSLEKKIRKIIIITFQRRKSLCNIKKNLNMQDEEDVFSFKGKDEVEIRVNIQIRQTLH